MSEPYSIALQVMRLAVAKLTGQTPLHPVQDEDVVRRTKEIVGWNDNASPQVLKLLFDRVKLEERSGEPREDHYWIPHSIENIADDDGNDCPSIPYPVTDKPLSDLEKYKKQLSEIKELKLSGEDWKNLNLLTLIVEKYGSYISLSNDEEGSDIALVDMSRSMTAIATALSTSEDKEKLCLIAGDLSGIQKFIYTITSDGALKSLRARSFYLELLAEEIVQQVLEAFNLQRTSVIYASGGNLYILAPYQKELSDRVRKIKDKFNEWFLQEFQGKLFLALGTVDLSVDDLNTGKLSNYWQKANEVLSEQKERKFNEKIDNILDIKTTYEACKVCHRDDEQNLKPLDKSHAPDVMACSTCRDMYRIGGEIFRVRAIVRTTTNISKSQKTIKLLSSNNQIFYHLFESPREALDQVGKLRDGRIFLTNNWNVYDYKSNSDIDSNLLVLGNYGQKTEEKEKDNFIRASEMAKHSKGIKRVGYLRMDVDNLGKIFANGLNKELNLARLIGLSRQMTYLFKVYLNRLASHRERDFLNSANNFSFLDRCPRKNLLFIYTGGDDLFINGSWNELVEFAFDIYQVFRAYTGWNSDITLSGGLTLATIKYPLYQAANEAEKAEKSAKNNGRDSLTLFGETFKWSEWIGNTNIEPSNIEVYSEIGEYLQTNATIELFGILPIMKTLEKLKGEYTSGFIQNLLATAQIQEQKIEEIRNKNNEEALTKDIQYYLHLPKIAYTLSRLSRPNKNDPKIQDFENVSVSLKNPWNAPYYKAIATWLALLNRSESSDKT
jgi:CRISPR-associated protein Csm1